MKHLLLKGTTNLSGVSGTGLGKYTTEEERDYMYSSMENLIYELCLGDEEDEDEGYDISIREEELTENEYKKYLDTSYKNVIAEYKDDTGATLYFSDY